MTVQLVTTTQRWNGHSADEKPTTGVREGSEFHTVDTGEEFIFHNQMWVKDLRKIKAIQDATI